MTQAHCDAVMISFSVTWARFMRSKDGTCLELLCAGDPSCHGVTGPGYTSPSPGMSVSCYDAP